jgi:hypothetical protein
MRDRGRVRSRSTDFWPPTDVRHTLVSIPLTRPFEHLRKKHQLWEDHNDVRAKQFDISSGQLAMVE